MSSIQWISLLLVGGSIMILIISCIKSKKIIQPVITQITQLATSTQLEIHHFTQEIQFQNEKLKQLKQKIACLQKTLQSDTLSLQHFQTKQKELQHSLDQLNEVLPRLVVKVSKSMIQQIKDETPHIWKIFTYALKKTFQKQKARFSNK
ncbi:hypothetical protein [Allofustis seminis]|uniref:hypothetical protein n=1 Tax=Allofustis seminis TaxID=166939 RepID=UPI00037BD72B|nr:hypothetical protein [Allofustis seminis]